MTELRKTSPMMRGVGRGKGRSWSVGGVRSFGHAGNYNTGSGVSNFSGSDEGGNNWLSGLHPCEIRRKETLDRARMEQIRQRGGMVRDNASGEVGGGGGGGEN